MSHNVFIAKIANMEVMDFLGQFAPYTVGVSLAVVVMLSALCFFYGAIKKAA